MTGYKLTYFNARGRAEVARQIFILNDVEFEDKRIEKEEWPQVKSSLGTPFGQLPILEVDGTIICQSNAINRYLAKTFGLAGETNIEAARVDMIVDCIEDLLKPIYTIYKCRPEEKEELLKKYEKEDVPEVLDKLEKLLAANSLDSGYFVGPKMTWADITFPQMTGQVEKMFNVKIDWSRFPKLNALRLKVEGHPKIAAWIAKRPQTAS